MNKNEPPFVYTGSRPLAGILDWHLFPSLAEWEATAARIRAREEAREIERSRRIYDQRTASARARNKARHEATPAGVTHP